MCDCDLDNDGFCLPSDFTLLVADTVTGTDRGVGSDMDGSGRVDDADFDLFLAGFEQTGVPGPAAEVQPIEACFADRLAVTQGGAARRWTREVPALGCTMEGAALSAAGFAEAVADLNNPTDAWVSSQTDGEQRCPNAAFASFTSASVCGPGLPCDPDDHGLACGAPSPRGVPVACGDPLAPRACELHDVCRNQCGYWDPECDAQLRRNLVATCEALRGEERTGCLDDCLRFADLYADAVEGPVPPVPGEYSARDLAQEQRDCACCPEAVAGSSVPPPVCGNGTCEATETCHPSSCPEDCGTCDFGVACLVDADCGEGACNHAGVCELLGAGALCAFDTHCASGVCTGGACTAGCGDQVCDGAETCQSCAGDCGSCGTGESCAEPSQCASGLCDGGTCAGRADTTACTQHAQCASDLCNLGVCIPDPVLPGDTCDSNLACAFSSCVDGVCKKPAATACAAPGECRSGACDAGTCSAVCGDGYCDGGEACGTSDAAGCAADCGLCELSGACDTDADCANGQCIGDQCRVPVSTKGLLGFCVEDSDCDLETETCDYARCLPIYRNPLGSFCTEDSDCESEYCVGFACAEDLELGEGEPCEKTRDCKDFANLSCNLGICTSEGSVPEGGDCDWEGRFACSLGQCIPGLGKCRSKQANGVPCFQDEICISGICTYAICTGDSCGNDTCDLWEKCGSTPNVFRSGSTEACQEDCGLCEPGDRCAANMDCASGVCVLGFCGSVKHAIGHPCDEGEDCVSGRCALDEVRENLSSLPLPGLCIADCGNGTCEGVEDCGDANGRFECNDDCGTCPNDVACWSNSDCTSGVCNGFRCSPGGFGYHALCSTDAACRSGSCEVGLCGATCGDDVCEGLEACGDANQAVGECGDDCGLCGNGVLCSAGTDCQSGICNLFQCDAGGRGLGALCSTDAVCRSGVCRAGLCAASCGDGVCEGVENCGGDNLAVGECFSDCGRCSNGSLCSAGTDCASGYCNVGICSSCSIFGLACTQDSQCCSGNCTTGIFGNQFCGL
jgi:hypothetical protein